MSRRSGQVTVLVLLLGLLGLAASLSLASRSLSDLRQAIYVDSGIKALAAAEAGLQYASTLAGADCLSHELVNTQSPVLSLSGVKSVSYTTCTVTKTTITVPSVAVDDVVQVDLTGASANLKGMDVSWLGDASVEIEVLDSDDTLRRYAYNAVGQNRNNGFAAAIPGSNCTSGCDASFAIGSCTGPSEICYKPDCGVGNVKAQLVRVKPLYQSAPINICARAAGGSGVTSFGTQYYLVTVTATTLNGTVRRIQADRYPPGLPAIFDNVLSSGGSLAK